VCGKGWIGQTERECRMLVTPADIDIITPQHKHDEQIEGGLPMRTVRAPSIAAWRVTHVVLPFVIISPTPLQSTTDCVLLWAAGKKHRRDNRRISDILTDLRHIDGSQT
jgi:hypothetical protein